MLPSFKVRAGQRAFERFVEKHRVAGLIARRQYGKTTIAGRISLKKMMKFAGHTVIFGSVKLDLGREIVRKEADILHQTISTLTSEAGQAGKLLSLHDQSRDKPFTDLRPEDFAELYEAQRLEFRLYHSRTIYSRTKVVALTPDTVGETGDLIADEVGRARRFRETWEAIAPIIASNPGFRAILTTTPPPDDSHFSFELLSPPIGSEFPVNAQGNVYRSELGVSVLRISAWDAYADNIPLYDDDTGEPIDPDTARAKAFDKDAWDRNYGVKFVLGGTAACGLIQLDTAQRRGIDQTIFKHIDDESDLDDALAAMVPLLGTGKIGLGWDLATTEKQSSNPSGFAVVEQQGHDYVVRGLFTWKTKDPDIALSRAKKIITSISSRQEGGRARALSIDATNERYFSSTARKTLAGELPVHLVVGSETADIPGDEPMNMKQYLGSLLVGALDDNRLTLPADRYVREDFRLVKKEKGQFVCEPDSLGRHGDTFDAAKQAIYAIVHGSAHVQAKAVSTGHTASIPLRPGIKNPLAKKVRRITRRLHA